MPPRMITRPAPPAVPEAVTMRQFCLALLARPHTPEPPLPAPFDGGTQLDAVNALIAGSSRYFQEEWRTAHEVRRDHPFVAASAIGFGYDEAGIDAFFVEAAGIGPPTVA